MSGTDTAACKRHMAADGNQVRRGGGVKDNRYLRFLITANLIF